MKTILLYGDSNTWGLTPILPAGQICAMSGKERWGGVLQAQLGDDYNVLEEGLGAAPRHWRIPPPPGEAGWRSWRPSCKAISR